MGEIAEILKKEETRKAGLGLIFLFVAISIAIIILAFLQIGLGVNPLKSFGLGWSMTLCGIAAFSFFIGFALFLWGGEQYDPED